MPRKNDKQMEERVARTAEAVLAERRFVTSIDVLVGLGWLGQSGVEDWRRGRVAYLEAVTFANLSKISRAMRAFRRWAERRGLKPSETSYVRRTRGHRRSLRFSKSGTPAIERAYRTHWVSPGLAERKRMRLVERSGETARPTSPKRPSASDGSTPARPGQQSAPANIPLEATGN
jgi:hypothetical protein